MVLIGCVRAEPRVAIARAGHDRPGRREVCATRALATLDLIAGDSHVVGRGRPAHVDLARRGGGRGEVGGRGGWLRVRSRGDRRVHVSLDLGLAQCAVVQADLVDDPLEVVAARASADDDVLAGVVVLARRDGAAKHTIVEDAVHVNVERGRGGVEHPGHVVPGVELPHRVAVALGDRAAVRRDPHPERLWAGVRTGLELPASAVGLGDDLTVIGGVGGGVDPGAPGHAAGDLQVRRVSEIHVVRRPVERRARRLTMILE